VRAIFDTVPVPLIWISLETGAYACNRSFQETYSWQPSSSGRWQDLIRKLTDPKKRDYLLQRWRMQTALIAGRADGSLIRIDEVELGLLDGHGRERTVLHRGILAPE
jgi:hypothetical protein